MAIISLLVVVGLIVALWRPWKASPIAEEKSLVLYSAAGLKLPVEKIVADYKLDYGVRVDVDYGSSGEQLTKFRATPERVDLYLAGDASYTDKAREFGLIAETIPAARMRPVIVVHAESQAKWEAEGRPVKGPDDLLRDDVRVILANPEAASVGQTGKNVLTRSGHWEKIEQRIRQSGAQVSTVGTVNEVAQLVRLRPEHTGIVWDAVAQQFEGLAVVEVPDWNDAVQDVTVAVASHLKGERATAALQFARYLTARDKGELRFAESQYEAIPDADLWAERPEIVFMSGAMLKPGIEQTIKDFEDREGVKINTTYNGCGILVSQMRTMRAAGDQEHFPDAYFSCDTSFMSMVQPFFAKPVTISQNEIVMIVAKGNPKGIRSLSDLENPELKVGLGHPENSALGALTDLMFKRLGLHEKIYAEGWRDHIVYSDAGHDLVNKALTGALDIAVVYRSNASATPENLQKSIDIVEIGAEEALATQPFAVGVDSNHKYLMQRFLRAITAQTTADRFRAMGFRWVVEEPGGGESHGGAAGSSGTPSQAQPTGK
ncbi:MAG: substrate-binding domain-containing protein [Planctomycetota bacterium]